MRFRKITLIISTLLGTLFFTSCGGGPAAQTGSLPGNSASPSAPQSSTCSGMSLGQGASLNGFRPFPSTDPWNQDISAAAVDPNSAAIINFIGPSIGLHPDFGSGTYAGSSIGIPYTVVDGSQALVNINFTAYGSKSDPGPMPIPVNAAIEGYPNPGNGDPCCTEHSARSTATHAIILEWTKCRRGPRTSQMPSSG